MAMLIPGGGEVGEQGRGDRHRPHVSFTSGSYHFIGGSHLITNVSVMLESHLITTPLRHVLLPPPLF